MTIQISRSEIEVIINRRLQSGTFKDAEEVILHALKISEEKGPTDDARRREAIEHLRTFGRRHNLSLDGMTIRELRREARP